MASFSYCPNPARSHPSPAPSCKFTGKGITSGSCGAKDRITAFSSNPFHSGNSGAPAVPIRSHKGGEIQAPSGSREEVSTSRPTIGGSPTRRRKEFLSTLNWRTDQSARNSHSAYLPTTRIENESGTICPRLRRPGGGGGGGGVNSAAISTTWFVLPSSVKVLAIVMV